MVSGESPSERQPRQSGCVVDEGIRMRPCVTSGAVLNEVVTVQKIGNRQMKAQKRQRAVDGDRARRRNPIRCGGSSCHCVSPWSCACRRLNSAMISGHRDDDDHEVDHGEQRAVADVRAVAVLAIDEARHRCRCAPPGPPEVTVMMMSASLSLKMMRMTMTVTETGSISGKVTSQKLLPAAWRRRRVRPRSPRLGDGLQAGEEHDHHEGDEGPGVEHHDRQPGRSPGMPKKEGCPSRASGRGGRPGRSAARASTCRPSS